MTNCALCDHPISSHALPGVGCYAIVHDLTPGSLDYIRCPCGKFQRQDGANELHRNDCGVHILSDCDCDGPLIESWMRGEKP